MTSRSAIRFSRVIPDGSEDDPPLLGELAADAAEQLVAVDAAGGAGLVPVGAVVPALPLSLAPAAPCSVTAPGADGK